MSPCLLWFQIHAKAAFSMSAGSVIAVTTMWAGWPENHTLISAIGVMLTTYHCARSEALSSVALKSQVSWDVAQCHWGSGSWCFEGSSLGSGRWRWWHLEISGTIALGLWCNIPEDLNCYLLLLLRSGAVPLQDSQGSERLYYPAAYHTRVNKDSCRVKNVWSPIQTSFIVITC
jgi:hypothetical protein